MLPERKATSYAHDPAAHSVVVVCEGAVDAALHGDVSARVLLDGTGHLVGIDVAPDRTERIVVMLGPHERVTEAVETTVHVEPSQRTLTLRGSVEKRVTPGASPYVR